MPFANEYNLNQKYDMSTVGVRVDEVCQQEYPGERLSSNKSKIRWKKAKQKKTLKNATVCMLHVYSYIYVCGRCEWSSSAIKNREGKEIMGKTHCSSADFLPRTFFLFF